ncbi:roadblock/LC7 domain-containing protein [Promethearchaeum syntrophicum]|uniref:Roadblock/LC7 domain-containing protein n=1 Tax=Promethearchaeum syntrophicum TaxID=2594042 RepID=A0A5B9D785_9ARCH|nr:roadblock/LC7 domain-containing protein [Candidatus Prometheoarchaeum syntrophicum]QEE14853.1 hypothetical protein DSAG12_00673 [Candidatus Prometheoarchaeum syntrophicum]
MLQDEIKRNLEKIKATRGVENVVLTQRDGNPIHYTGIWFSKEEIFSISAATSAIYNCGIELHKDNLKYILIEGNKAKILLFPLKNYGSTTLNKIIRAQDLQGNDNDFFVAITAQNMINLGGIFLKTRNSLIEIKKSLILSGESFKPPLRHFSKKNIDEIIGSSNVRDDIKISENVQLYSLNIPEMIYKELDNILRDLGNQTLDLVKSYIAIEGGFIVSSYPKLKIDQHKLDSEATMGYSLFKTADKCAWLLKKMRVNSILLECVDKFQFINKVDSNIFSIEIGKGRQKLGLLRLIIPRYCKKITSILEEARKYEIKPVNLNLEKMFTELIF